MDHRFVMLKPMKPGVSGFARIQPEAGGALMQLHARGLGTAGIRAFWYHGGGEMRELGGARVNPLGEASLTALLPAGAAAPERLCALLVISAGSAPAPLLCGLCAQQSAGSLTDAKNALLALCERIRRAEVARAQPPEREKAPLVSAPPQATRLNAPTNAFAARKARKPRAVEASREIFLPAIDPSPYVLAREPEEPPSELREGAPSVAADNSEAPPAPRDAAQGESSPAGKNKPYADALATAQAPFAQAKSQSGAKTELAKPNDETAPSVLRLPKLRWVEALAPLQEHFDRLLPVAVLDLPGWRFVEIRKGLFVGRLARDGCVGCVAYALRADAPPADGKPYQPLRGLSGEVYQVLWQRVSGA